MPNITSKIKTILGSKVNPTTGDKNLLRYIAAICDTKRIESSAEKMILLCDLLYTYGVSHMILGGATNRVVLQIDGYAVKFAMDEQGYRDNLIEYSLSSELQPFVTKSYETNGYILIAECVEVINTEAKWKYHKTSIKKILDALAQDYLLGDVGYIAKNMTNWGIRDNKPVILDYAYCHKFTENLFICGQCGHQLTYDENYDILMCTNRSQCRSRYTYNERKRIQGEQVDLDMIAERKKQSIRLPGEVTSKEITILNNEMIGDNIMVINNREDYNRFLQLRKERLNMELELMSDSDLTERLDAMIQLVRNPNDSEARNIVTRDTADDSDTTELQPMYTDQFRENCMGRNDRGLKIYAGIDARVSDADNVYDGDDVCDTDPVAGLDALILKVRAKSAEKKSPVVSEEPRRFPREDSNSSGGNRNDRDKRKHHNGKPHRNNGGGKQQPRNNDQNGIATIGEVLGLNGKTKLESEATINTSKLDDVKSSEPESEAVPKENIGSEE